jgi:hypothetical protein
MTERPLPEAANVRRRHAAIIPLRIDPHKELPEARRLRARFAPQRALGLSEVADRHVVDVGALAVELCAGRMA